MPARDALHPMALLQLLAGTGPVHRNEFIATQDRVERKISKASLRALRRRGWLHDCTDYAWVLTDAGHEAAATQSS